MAFSFSTGFSKQGFQKIVKKFSENSGKSMFRKPVTVLSVTLINGRFKALSIINDSIHQSWDRPGVIRKPEILRQAIAEAIERTEFPGTHSAMLVEDQRFMTLMLQLPPMPHTDLMCILDRKAQRVKTWEGPVVWCHYPGMQARQKQWYPP